MTLKKPDMRYKLTSLEEPTDEQSAWIMKEVCDDTRAQSKREKEIVMNSKRINRECMIRMIQTEKLEEILLHPLIVTINNPKYRLIFRNNVL